jgi:hypothetical protein
LKVPPQKAPAHLSAQGAQIPDPGVQGQMFGKGVCWKALPQNDPTRRTTNELVVVSDDQNDGASGHDGTQSQVLSQVPVISTRPVWQSACSGPLFAAVNDRPDLWHQVQVHCGLDRNQHWVGKMGLEPVSVSIYVQRHEDGARPPQMVHGLPNHKLMKTIEMHNLIDRTNRLMDFGDCSHDGRCIVAQKAFMEKNVRAPWSRQQPNKMFTLIPWMEILSVLCMWVADGRYRAECCYLEFVCKHGRHRSLGAAFLVACFLKMLGANVTLVIYGRHRLCGCCTDQQFGWQQRELKPIARWVGQHISDRANPELAWHIIAETIGRWGREAS